MKKLRNIKVIVGISIFFVLLGMVSCEDYLDKSAESSVSEDDAYEDFTSFQGFTEELYNCIVNFSTNYWTNSWNWGEDEITSTSITYHFINKIDVGNFWGWQSNYDGWHSGWMEQDNFTTETGRSADNKDKDLWNAAWYGIRKANIGLENIGKLTDATDEERNLIKGQLLFFRGWFHHRLMEYFGGLPYINYVLPSDGKLTLPRLSYQACADSAAKDFREAADLLPIDWDETTVGKNTLGDNDLRINKIMALAYLGKNYLWAGSPLMNQESTGSKSYNTDYCQKAAAAFAELLELVESGETQYALMNFSKISDNFYTQNKNWEMPGGTEAIFRGPYSSANNSNWGTSKQYTPSPAADNNALFLPTANYVDYYGMANGLPINDNYDATQADAASGYNPEYPWRDRDPRFYTDIIYDGVKFIQGSTTDTANRYANLYTDGSYRNVANGSRTGYVLRKFIPITCNKYDLGWDYGYCLHIYIPYMRLADVYLMYAEAAAAGYNSPTGKDAGYSRTAVDAVNVIRDRAGVGHVADKFLGSLDAFMPELRRERAVELSFEGHRFNDLRRWLLLTESPYTLKKSVEFDRAVVNRADPTQSKVLNLREELILQRDFESKHYWLPLKNEDVYLYLEFSQNPGW
jgi:starch-binding outer membrane protein, SusD/RagB family